MDNALDPNLMTASERLTEIGEILAAGLVRGCGAKEREPATAESFPWTSPPPGASMAGNENQEKGHE